MALLGACTSKPQESETEHQHDLPKLSSKGYLDSLQSGLILNDTLKGSPSRVAMNTVGNAHVHITYQSPGVKGRVIFGGLVAYNTVWVTGAHQATNVMISEPIEINGIKIDKGTYAIFTIPGEEEWTFILNKNYKQHLADDYNEAEDVVRLEVKSLQNEFTPRLTYAVTAVDDTNGIIAISWDKIRIDVPFKSL